MRPPIETLQKWFAYDPEAGHLIRKIKSRCDLSDIVPYSDNRVYFKGDRYPYTHVIWAVHFGYWPKSEIDHVDHDETNNKITNLREATASQNIWNRRGFGKYPKGVALDNSTYRAKPWIARISIHGKSKFLGSFATMAEAREAYLLAALEHHGDFACLE